MVPIITSSEFLAKADFFIRKSRPVIINQLSPSFNPVLKTLQDLCHLAGDSEINVYFPKVGNTYDSRSKLEKKSVKLKDFYEYLSLNKNSNGLYTVGIPILSLRNSRITQDTELPIEYKRTLNIKKVFKTGLWIGGKTFSPLHFDDAENLCIQIQGCKKFLLIPPGFKGLYARSVFSGTSNISKIIDSIESPDLLEKFPKFKDVPKPLVVNLKPGEMLYIPYAWWHQVHSIDDINVAFNYWFLPSLTKSLKYPNQFFRVSASDFLLKSTNYFTKVMNKKHLI